MKNLVLDNVIAPTFMQEFTAFKPIHANNLSLGYQKVTEKSFKINMLGLCVFSLILGFALIELDEQVTEFKLLLEQINTTVMKIMMSFVR